MTSTYVNDLRLNEMATGDASGSWGTVTNTNLELIGEALGYGTEAITTNADTHTSTIADGATDPIRAIFIKYTGTLDSACTITIGPNTVNKFCFIHNATSGSQSIIISQGSGANVTIATGQTKGVYLDGAGSGAAVIDAFAALSVVDLLVDDDLTVTDDVAIGGLATVGGTLGVTGVATFGGGTSISTAGVLSLEAGGSLTTAAGNDLNIVYPDGRSLFFKEAGTTTLTLDNAQGATFAGAALVTGVLTTTAATVFNGGFAANDGCTITTADNSNQLTLISTDADASAGPVMEFYRNSSSPADSDSTGLIYFTGENDADEKVYYGQIFSQIQDASNGTEDSSIDFITMVAGTGRSRMYLFPTETVFNEDSADLDFRVESNLDTDSFVLDGGTGAIKMVGPSGVDGSPLTTVTLTVEEGGYNNGNTFQVTNTSGGVRFCSSGYGVIGVGIQPEIWDSSYKALQIGDAGALFGGDDNSFVAVSANVYYDDTNNRYEYINDDFASQYYQVNGNHIFKTAASGSADGAITLNEVMRLHPTGQISIGTSAAPTTQSMVLIEGDGGTDNSPFIEFQNSSTINDENLGGFIAMIGTDSVGQVSFKRESSTSSGYFQVFTQPNGGAMTERLRINADGNLLFGDNLDTSAATNDVAGVTVGKVGNIQASVSGNPCLFVNRKTNDGTIVSIRQAGSEEGTISVSGSTVSYNAFSGSHWSRLTDNSQPTILKGTLIETIDEMCDWYQAQFTIPATTKVNEDGTVEDVAAYTVKEPIALPDGASVGDTISHISNGVTYSATIVKESDNKHTKCKISDTADSLRVYGVFAAWDGDDDTVNDMYVTAVGTHVVRIHGGQTVSAGDLLVSNGDGTAKVQDDDIIRSKTLGKVLTHIKQETYADNSYTVPCALYCG